MAVDTSAPVSEPSAGCLARSAAAASRCASPRNTNMTLAPSLRTAAAGVMENTWRGPNGAEKGPKWGPNGAEKAPKWGPNGARKRGERGRLVVK
eukprot:6386606-Pyramimonas_sp.AAC.1